MKKNSKIYKELKAIIKEKNEEGYKLGLETPLHGLDFSKTLDDGREYRFIHMYAIDAIFDDEFKAAMAKQSALLSISMLSVNWEKSKKDYGQGRFFAKFDGKEIFIDNWFVFRTR